jgi:hypothetical protein
LPEPGRNSRVAGLDGTAEPEEFPAKAKTVSAREGSPWPRRDHAGTEQGRTMSNENSTGGEGRSGSASPPDATRSQKAAKADWSHSLRHFYDSVVDEPLPDNFRELLSGLDK